MKRSAKQMEELVIAGLIEAVAIHKGEKRPARSRTRTARDTDVEPPPEFTARRVVAVREALAISQPVFAKVLNVSPALVRGWERGARTPSGAAARLLQLAERGEVRFGAVEAPNANHAMVKRVKAAAKKTRRV